MDLRPLQRILASRSGAAVGVMLSPVHYTTDYFDLLQGVSGVERAGIFFEPNTKTLMLEPVAFPRDLGLSDVTTSGLTTMGTPGSWREVTDRATGKKSLSQTDGNADREYAFEVNDTSWLSDNAEFCIHLNLWPCPKGASHDRENYFRHFYFPSSARAGEVMYRIAFHYGEEPRLLVSYDGATAAFTDRTAYFTDAGTIPSSTDLQGVRNGKNVPVTLTVMQVDGHINVWCGNDLSRFTLSLPVPVSTVAGKWRFEGKNGLAEVGFSDLDHKHYGYFISYPQYGPAHMRDLRPRFIAQPEITNSGHRVSGRIESIDAGRSEFQYRLTLEAPNLGGDKDGYAATSPIVKQVTVAWPSIWKPPQSGGETLVKGVNRIEEYQSFDLQSGIADTTFKVELDNSLGEYLKEGGLIAARVLLGHEHTGLYQRGVVLGRNNNTWTLEGAKSRYEWTGRSLLYLLNGQTLFEDVYPAHWCAYTMARFLLEHGGIVPALMSSIPICQPGPYPNCPHPLIGAHEGWKSGTGILPCLMELREIIGGWLGEDATGQFRFEPFLYNAPRPMKRIYREAAGGAAGEQINEILTGSSRSRSLDEVINQILLTGWDRTTGQLYVRKIETPLMTASLNDPSSPNYLGFKRTLRHRWTGYDTPTYTDAVGEEIAKYAALPGEAVLLNLPGQPDIWQQDQVGAVEKRIIGNGARYWVTGLSSVWDERVPGTYSTTLLGQWTGLGGGSPGY